MDHSPTSSVKKPRLRRPQNVVWPAVTSALLVTGFATNAADSSLPAGTEIVDPTGSSTGPADRWPEKTALPPTINLASFNERFGATPDAEMITAKLSLIDPAGADFADDDSSLPGEAAGSARARRERAVLSRISVFSFDPGSARPLIDLATEPSADVGRSSGVPRPDLLSGVPENYAKLALAIAAEEEVDPNWVLSIMRAENAAFDPGLVSSAGAVGLMQMMPKIGEAFGAKNLADPEQNIRAGVRFLRVLIDKYRNPVLIASAYNAGEPRVDVHQSLPLIRETADYVTRVVGYYTGGTAISRAPGAGPSSRPEPDRPRRTGSAGRAKSPMLVFSVPDPLSPDARLHQTEKAAQFGGAVKIVKEEVVQ